MVPKTFTLIIFLFVVSTNLCHGVSLFENVALKKNCSHSSQYHHRKHKCGYAINRDTSGNYNYGSNCIHTAENDWTPWWQVDLGQTYPIHHMVLWGRSADEGHSITRMSGCQITVDGDLCYTFGTVSVTDNRTFDITCNPPRSGQVIRVEKNTSSSIQGGWNDKYSINMCELEVYACISGLYGDKCARSCSNGCADTCNRINGQCTCKPGWTGALCDTACLAGRYGDKCTSSCSDGCADTCNHVDGQCTCTPGWYGVLCTYRCSDGCADTCNHVDGQCTCKPEWYGALCDTDINECSSNPCGNGGTCSDRIGYYSCACVHGYTGTHCETQVCPQGRHGLNCAETCSEGCQLGICTTSDGHCSCLEGWTGDKCDEEKTEDEEPVSVEVIWIATTVGIVFIILVIVVVVVVVYRRRRRNDGVELQIGVGLVELNNDARNQQDTPQSDYEEINLEQPERGMQLPPAIGGLQPPQPSPATSREARKVKTTRGPQVPAARGPKPPGSGLPRPPDSSQCTPSTPRSPAPSPQRSRHPQFALNLVPPSPAQTPKSPGNDPARRRGAPKTSAERGRKGPAKVVSEEAATVQDNNASNTDAMLVSTAAEVVPSAPPPVASSLLASASPPVASSLLASASPPVASSTASAAAEAAGLYENVAGTNSSPSNYDALDLYENPNDDDGYTALRQT